MRQKDETDEGSCQEDRGEEGRSGQGCEEGPGQEEEVSLGSHEFSPELPVMRSLPGAVSLLAALLVAVPAWSVTLTNRDDRDHKITVIEGSARQDHRLASQAVLEGVCIKGCVIRLNDSDNDEYELEGNEIVSIEDGYLYYDGPDAPADAAPAEPAKPETRKQ